MLISLEMSQRLLLYNWNLSRDYYMEPQNKVREPWSLDNLTVIKIAQQMTSHLKFLTSPTTHNCKLAEIPKAWVKGLPPFETSNASISPNLYRQLKCNYRGRISSSNPKSNHLAGVRTPLDPSAIRETLPDLPSGSFPFDQHLKAHRQFWRTGAQTRSTITAIPSGESVVNRGWWRIDRYLPAR